MSRIRTITEADIACLPASSSAGRYIYLIGEVGDRNLVKIGIAAHPLWRLYDHQSGNHRRLELLAAWECADKSDARRLEKAAHRHFEAKRLSGEWYGIPWAEAYDFIADLARQP